MLKLKIKELNSKGFSHDLIILAFVLIFAVAGVGYLVASHASPSHLLPPLPPNTSLPKSSLPVIGSPADDLNQPALAKFPRAKPYKGLERLPLLSRAVNGKAVAEAPEQSDAGCFGCNYYYAGNAGFSNQVGLFAYLTMNSPYVGTFDYHSLIEMAIESSDGQQVVEAGWTVDHSAGDLHPRLFVFHWVNGAPSCYDGCGWVQYSSSYYPGQPTNPNNAGQQFFIEQFGNAWWIGFAGQWMGYFPDSLWTSQGVNFTHFGFSQIFGEVAASSNETLPCSQMGNGAYGSSGNGAGGYADAYYFNGSTWEGWANLWQTPFVTNSNLYNIKTTYYEGATLGGPAHCY